ncbi:MAG: hypothetical protein ACXVKC_04410 [Candidatus Angelobacter sp.]
MKVGFVLILIIFTFNLSYSQARHGRSGSSAHSSLTVTATVEPSVWLDMEADGKRELVVANAPDPQESFSHAPAGKAAKKSAVPAKEQNSSTTLPHHQHAAVQFSFPMAPRQFEVTRKTVVMDVTEDGRAERRPVTVTTVVPQ